MSNERKLIDYINNIYAELGFELTDEQKLIYESGVATGITFALSQLIDLNIDLSILGNYFNNKD